jgi:hypothetical protein
LGFLKVLGQDGVFLACHKNLKEGYLKDLYIIANCGIRNNISVLVQMEVVVVEHRPFLELNQAAAGVIDPYIHVDFARNYVENACRTFPDWE